MRRKFAVPFLLTIFAVLSPASLAAQVKPPVNPNSVRLAVIGDMGTGKPAQYDVAQRMIEARTIFPFDFVLMVGDNIYGGSKPQDFEAKFAIPYKPLLDAGVKFYASLGNHDDPIERYYAPYNMNGANYYTFKKGNVRFFALDSNYMDPKQLAWLETQLRDAGSDWKICYFHHPLYSSARYHGPSTDLRLLLEPLFIKYGVNVVFSGHDHVYERIKPQNGIYYFVEGSSGELRPGDLNGTALAAKGFDSDNTFMLVEIAGNQMNFQAVSRAGQIVDAGTITGQSQGQTQIQTPSPVQALPAQPQPVAQTPSPPQTQPPAQNAARAAAASPAQSPAPTSAQPLNVLQTPTQASTLAPPAAGGPTPAKAAMPPVGIVATEPSTPAKLKLSELRPLIMSTSAWISILFGIPTMAFAIFASRFVANAELPLTEEERNRLLKKKPPLWHRVVGVCVGMAFCLYGVFVLLH